ncbi:MAG: hypothetical protein COB02_15550 [Candidatus Cloacimonadota bacterium]|nr:MAG: hypothetical protein COB02_15550 [Candidatus Cloacimonadota bacterium]
MLQLKNIHKNYGNTIALKDINLEFEKGKIYLLLGPNGAGKTTLNQIISGILFADQGDLFFEGKKLKTSQKIPYSISYLGDTDLFDEKMRVFDFLKLIAKLKSSHLNKDDIESVLTKFDLHPVKSKMIQNLSLGYKQRVGLAQAFLGKSDILILDEPGSGLDPIQFQELKENIHLIKKNTIVIISTHRIREAKELAESVVLLFEGKILYSGESSKELSNAVVHSFTLNKPSIDFENYLSQKQFEYYLSNQSTYHLERLNQQQKFDILQFLIDTKIDIVSFESNEQNLEDLYFKLIQKKETPATLPNIPKVQITQS